MQAIGERLREARMRQGVDLSEVEAATKIRAKYLRALENEEWALLPGPTFVKTFLRTYAEYLGLDPRALVEEYRQRYERPTMHELSPLGGLGGQRRRRGPPPLLGPGLGLLLGVVILVGFLYVLGTIGQQSNEGMAPLPKLARKRLERYVRVLWPAVSVEPSMTLSPLASTRHT